MMVASAAKMAMRFRGPLHSWWQTVPPLCDSGWWLPLSLAHLSFVGVDVVMILGYHDIHCLWPGLLLCSGDHTFAHTFNEAVSYFDHIRGFLGHSWVSLVGRLIPRWYLQRLWLPLPWELRGMGGGRTVPPLPFGLWTYMFLWWGQIHADHDVPGYWCSHEFQIVMGSFNQILPNDLRWPLCSH